MFVILWQFDIAEEKTSSFESAYGPQGSWAGLFARSPEYLGTGNFSKTLTFQAAMSPSTDGVAKKLFAPSAQSMTLTTKPWTASAIASPLLKPASAPSSPEMKQGQKPSCNLKVIQTTFTARTPCWSLLPIA